MQLKEPTTAVAVPPEAARLRVALPDPYVYKSAWKRGLAWGLDAVGGLVFGRPPQGVDWAHQDRIAVLRLDHLGDLLHALPALRRLRLVSPRARIDLWVGPWGQELASLFADVDTVRVTPAGWFERPQRQAWPWRQIWSLASGLNKEHYSAAIELRGDLRHHLALRMAGIPVRAGQALTAGAFLLTHPAVWQPDLHEQDQGLSVLDGAWVPAHEQGSAPYLKLPSAAWDEAEAVAKDLQLGSRPILVQAACGTQAKRWPQASWAEVLENLPADSSVVLLGSASEKAEMEQIASKVKRPVAVAAGRLSLSGLAALISTARLVLSVDSGPAHLAAIQGVPVVSLFSATNRASQWAPRTPALGGMKGKVQVLQATGLPCAPCELSDCPYGNACMNALTPGQVLAAAQGILGTA
jgi:ADP-heptose:LPS heptosyltransferase